VPLDKVLGLQDLDKDELADLESVLNDQFDPCGRPISFRESLATKDPCERAIKMGNFLVGLVARGLSKKVMIVQYHRELKRVASRFTFDLTGSPVLGDPKSKNIIVEFTDFQCPHCERVSEPLKKLAQKYKAALYIKHLPLQIHSAARQAALASLAAHVQGKFWAVYEQFFKNQASLSSQTIPALLKKAGVDMGRFEKDVKAKALETLIQRDEAEADMAAVDGTPTIFLNGYMVEMEELEEKLGAAE
jgi:protein-disulfide isomerase